VAPTAGEADACEQTLPRKLSAGIRKVAGVPHTFRELELTRQALERSGSSPSSTAA